MEKGKHPAVILRLVYTVLMIVRKFGLFVGIEMIISLKLDAADSL